MLSEHPAPSAPAPTADLKQPAAVPLVDGPRSASAPVQTASQRQNPATDAAGPDPASSDPAQTASQQRSTVRGTGSKPAGSVPAQTANPQQRPVAPGTGDKSAPAQPAQRADSDEDADTWQFMTLPPPGTRALQSAARDAAPTESPPQAPAAEQQQPSPHDTGAAAADAPQAGGTDPKPSSHEWEAELEPEDGAEGGRTAAAVIAAATIAATGDGLSLPSAQGTSTSISSWIWRRNGLCWSMPFMLRKKVLCSGSHDAVAGGARRHSSSQPATDPASGNVAQPSQQMGSGGDDAAQEAAKLSAATPSPSAHPPASDASPADDAIEWEDVAPAAAPAPSPSMPARKPAVGGEDTNVSASTAAEQGRPQPVQPSETGE